MIKAQRDLQTGRFITPNRDKYRHWLRLWLDRYKKTRLRESTFCLYDNITKTHIMPNIGDIPLQKLETKDIQKIINGLHSKGKSLSLIKQVHLIISGSLKQAVREQKVFRNVAEAVELPKGSKKKVIPLTKEQVKIFMDSVKGNKHYTAFVLEIGTGLRRGELLALRWKDIDLKKGTLTVRETMGRVTKANGDRKTMLVFQPPKTERSKRVIKLKDNIIKILQAHQLATGKRDKPEELVFSNDKGLPLDPRSFAAGFGRLLERAGIPKTSFHALRHTVAIMLIQGGALVKNVQDLLGHEKYSTTMDIYAEYLPEEEKDKTAEQLDAIIGEII
jgi:integrase